jgi:serine/threonine-protein kinase
MNKLGKYQIRRILGQGAMGIVYEGFDPAIERTVAIKTILPSQLGGAEFAGVMARFKREAQAAGRLNHPGIVAIYDYGEELAQDISEEEATMMAAPAAPAAAQRVAYIAMEFVKGRELKDAFAQGERFPLPVVARLMTEVLEALDHAHANGVVHRDIKPANLILLPDGRIKIADFGIARIQASELTQAGAVLGTPSYMSPEQFMGAPVDGRSDLFSCGVILYQMLTGERPFTGESTTTIMYKVLREEPAPPSQLNLSLSPQLDAVVRKALAKAPADRFASGREFAQALQAAIAATGAAPAPAALPLATAPVVAAAPMAAAAPPVATAPRPRAALWLTGAVAGVALLAGGYLLVASQRQPASPVVQAPAATTPPAATSVPAAQPGAAAAPAPAAPPPAAVQPGTLVISAVGYADPRDARFHGDAAAAQLEARNAARRQLIEKALALSVDPLSIDGHRAVIERKLLANSGHYIRTVLQEGTPSTGTSGLLEQQTRAVVSLRDLQKSLNQLSREERIDFIRRQGDPRISLRIDVAGAGGPLARDRSQLAENVLKERIKSFGFRVWTSDGDSPAAPAAQPADFAIRGEVKLKQLSTTLPASGLTITKVALTSWTLKATDTATGEEVYLSTRLPTGQTWASEDQALAQIGKLVGDEFSRNFFLQHFTFRTQKTDLVFTGLPEGGPALMLRELRGMRAVLDAQPAAEPGRFQVQLAEGDAPDIVLDAVVRPLNARLGLECFSMAGRTGAELTVAYAPACATAAMRSRLETSAPTGWKSAPAARTPASLPRGPAAPLRNSA